MAFALYALTSQANFYKKEIEIAKAQLEERRTELDLYLEFESRF